MAGRGIQGARDFLQKRPRAQEIAAAGEQGVQEGLGYAKVQRREAVAKITQLQQELVSVQSQLESALAAPVPDLNMINLLTTAGEQILDELDALTRASNNAWCDLIGDGGSWWNMDNRTPLDAARYNQLGCRNNGDNTFSWAGLVASIIPPIRVAAPAPPTEMTAAAAASAAPTELTAAAAASAAQTERVRLGPASSAAMKFIEPSIRMSGGNIIIATNKVDQTYGRSYLLSAKGKTWPIVFVGDPPRPKVVGGNGATGDPLALIDIEAIKQAAIEARIIPPPAIANYVPPPGVEMEEGDRLEKEPRRGPSRQAKLGPKRYK